MVRTADPTGSTNQPVHSSVGCDEATRNRTRILLAVRFYSVPSHPTTTAGTFKSAPPQTRMYDCLGIAALGMLVVVYAVKFFDEQRQGSYAMSA